MHLADGLLAVLILLALWAALGIAEGLLGVGSWPKLTLTVGQCLGGAGIVALSCLVVTQICKTSFDAPKKAPWLLLFAAFFVLLCLHLLFWRQPGGHALSSVVAAARPHCFSSISCWIFGWTEFLAKKPASLRTQAFCLFFPSS